MDKYTLGLCTMGNSSAAIFKNEILIAAVEEERLSRIKNDGSFPYKAILEVLSICGINISDVNEVCIYWKPWQIQERVKGTFLKIVRKPSSLKHLYKRVSSLFWSNDIPDVENESGKWIHLLRVRKNLQNRIGKFSGKISYIDHHESHQKYAEAMRDWNEFISLSYDGGGEKHSTVLSVMLNGERKVLSRHNWPNSLGHFYSTFTGFLGFKMLEGEYKMMGLAPYGKPRFKELILREILVLKDRGRYQINTSTCDYHSALNGSFSAKMISLFGNPRNAAEPPSEEHIDIATSVQAALEEALVHMLNPAVEQFPALKKLVIGGGCALNVTANGKLISSGLFDEIIIPPAPHDAGCAIGACLAKLDKVNFNSVRSPYTGRSYSDNDIEASLKKFGVTEAIHLENDDLIARTVDLLVEKKIVAWFQDGAEFGPRALGNRSYLADPRNDSIRDQINDKIKKRELFRPFAPSVTIEASKDFFSMSQDSPYMNIVSRVSRSSIPAVTHVDMTARVHTVSKRSNPRYHQLISKFGENTGVPVLLNTSFNIQEPIVYSPDDAIKTFLASGVDALVIGNYVVLRRSE